MRPLATFSTRIEIAYRLGLISKEMADCYDVLRGMRNACAHKLIAHTELNKQKFAEFKELTGRMMRPKDGADLFKMFPQNDFVFGLMCMAHKMHLEFRLAKTSAVQDVVSENQLRRQWMAYFRKQGLPLIKSFGPKEGKHPLRNWP
jgi:hypothetical protein